MQRQLHGANLNALGERYRSRIAILFVLCVAVYFLIAFGEQAWRAQQLQAQVSEQQAAIAALDDENGELQGQLDAYSSGGWYPYVQSRARRDLSLTDPGETVLMVRWSAPPAAIAPEAEPVPLEDEAPNWRRWLDVFSAD